jgi:hypothetical protein
LLWGFLHFESVLSGSSGVAIVNNDLHCNNLRKSRMNYWPENYLHILSSVTSMGKYKSLMMFSPLFPYSATNIYLSIGSMFLLDRYFAQKE